jgi:NDP-sugar pyrophosphorylase family protein
MKGIILSAGKGERLRPFTDKIPKVMLKIGEKPLLEHQIELFKKHGIFEIAVNLHHHPEVIQNYFGDGSKWGVKIIYSLEPKLLGTAGAVKKLENFFKDAPFLVHYGDNLTDMNLKKIMAFHRKHQAPLTITLYRSPEPWTMGVVEIDKNGRVLKFIEKPKKDEIFTDLVNAGTYIMEPYLLRYIPKDQFFDFGQDFFPLLLKNKIPIYAVEPGAYVQDIGNLRRYKKAIRDFKEGKVKI